MVDDKYLIDSLRKMSELGIFPPIGEGVLLKSARRLEQLSNVRIGICPTCNKGFNQC